MKTIGLLFCSVSLVLSLSCNGESKKKDTQEEQVTAPSKEQSKAMDADNKELLLDKKWKLTKLNGKPLSELDSAAQRIFITFATEGNRVSGNSGCNTFGGTYKLKEGNRFETSQLISTMMACKDMAVEDQFIGILQKSDTYIIRENTLQITKARMAPLAEFELEQ